jgi:hypothetical protein
MSVAEADSLAEHEAVVGWSADGDTVAVMVTGVSENRPMLSIRKRNDQLAKRFAAKYTVTPVGKPGGPGGGCIDGGFAVKKLGPRRSTPSCHGPLAVTR